MKSVYSCKYITALKEHGQQVSSVEYVKEEKVLDPK